MTDDNVRLLMPDDKTAPDINVRDLFAAAALCGLCANPERAALSINEDVECAWIYADAMLDQRLKMPKDGGK